MNLYLSIAFTMIAGIAGMYLLAKTKAEQLGKFFKFVSYLVIVISGLSLICQLERAAARMFCSTSLCPPSEDCMPGMMKHKKIIMYGMHGNQRMHSGCEEMENCCSSCDEERMEGEMECCAMQMHRHGKSHDDMKEDDNSYGRGRMQKKIIEKDTVIQK